MPKRGYGVALQEDEIYVIYEARPEDRCMTSSQIHDKDQKLGKADRDIMMKLAARATWPPSPATAGGVPHWPAHVCAAADVSSSPRDQHAPCRSRDASLPGHGQRRVSAEPHMCVPPPARLHRRKTSQHSTPCAARAARPPSRLKPMEKGQRRAEHACAITGASRSPLVQHPRAARATPRDAGPGQYMSAASGASPSPRDRLFTTAICKSEVHSL